MRQTRTTGTPDEPETGNGAQRWLILGGVALGVAGLTAAAALAVGGPERVSGKSRQPLRHRNYRPNTEALAPAFAKLPEGEQDAIRLRMRKQAYRDGKRAARQRATAAAQRARRAQDEHGPARDANGVALGDRLGGAVQIVAEALSTFQSVSRQAAGLIDEYFVVTDQIDKILKGQRRADQRADGHKADP